MEQITHTYLSRWLAALALITALGCATPDSTDRYGVQTNFASLIPARISVLPCRNWPSTSRYAGQPLSNTSVEEANKICAGLDEFVVDGFRNQPFMRGFSPKAVAKLLDTNKQSALLKEIEMLWRPADVDCTKCRTPMKFYTTAVADQQLWRLWLTQLSKATRNADAILLPFISYHFTDRQDDRGLDVARRSIGIVLLLIDTGTGKLIWSGGRESYAANIDVPKTGPQSIQPPGIEPVLARVFVEDVWKEFPGRLFLQ
jgi:hypothetical protein